MMARQMIQMTHMTQMLSGVIDCAFMALTVMVAAGLTWMVWH